MHADTAAGGDEGVAIVQRVGEVGQAEVGSRTRRIDFGRTLHGKRLVWPFGVEFPDKVVETGLLLQAVHSGRSGCFFLQREMHALVAAVLLRVARLDALDGNAEAEPPHREFGDRLKRAFGLANGTPLSDRIAWGRPRSWKSSSKAVMARFSRVDSRASQSSRKREAWSVTVSGKQ